MSARSKIGSTYGWPWDKLGVWPDGRRPWHRAKVPRNEMLRPRELYGPGVIEVCWYGWVKLVLVLGFLFGLMVGITIGVLAS